VSSALKKRILNESVDARQHLIIPDTMNAPDKVDKLIDKLIKSGYQMYAVCLWAPLNATRKRGEPRSITEGKLWSPKDYDVSVTGTLNMARRFATGIRTSPGVWRGLTLWDNSVFPAKRCSLEEFTRLSGLETDAADEHLQQMVNAQASSTALLARATEAALNSAGEFFATLTGGVPSAADPGRCRQQQQQQQPRGSPARSSLKAVKAALGGGLGGGKASAKAATGSFNKKSGGGSFTKKAHWSSSPPATSSSPSLPRLGSDIGVAVLEEARGAACAAAQPLPAAGEAATAAAATSRLRFKARLEGFGVGAMLGLAVGVAATTLGFVLSSHGSGCSE
jgi:uncharacterized membrane protein (Fun14 family)